MKYFLGLICSLLLVIALAPIGFYCWGLSVVNGYPAPSQNRLSSSLESEIWIGNHGVGEPRIEAINIYGYIFYLLCQNDKGVLNEHCENKYPGIYLAALSIRSHVHKNLTVKGNGAWQMSWLAYTVWVSQNWNIHEILSTYQQAHKPGSRHASRHEE